MKNKFDEVLVMNEQVSNYLEKFPAEIVDLFDKYILTSIDVSKYHSLFEGILRIIIFIL